MNGRQVGILIIGCAIGITLIVLGVQHPWCDYMDEGICWVATQGNLVEGLSPRVPLGIGVGVIAATGLLMFVARDKSFSDDQAYKAPWG